MVSREEFEASLAVVPDDAVTMGVYADWLDEQGCHAEAAEWRFRAGAVRDIDLPALLDSYDWGEVFGEGDGGNCDDKTDACPPGAPVDCTPPKRADVAAVLAAVNGENDAAEWFGVFRLRDGRYLLAAGSCDYTGWDCRAGNSLEVAATLADLLQYAVTPDQLARLTRG